MISLRRVGALPCDAASRLDAQPRVDAVWRRTYDRMAIMVPMRDGVRLDTHVFVPKTASGRLRILLQRTPYGIEGFPNMLRGPYRELAAEGFIFAVRYASESSSPSMRDASLGTDGASTP